MTNQTAAEQRARLAARFEQMTGETAPDYATISDLMAWIRDEIGIQARKGAGLPR